MPRPRANSVSLMALCAGAVALLGASFAGAPRWILAAVGVAVAIAVLRVESRSNAQARRRRAGRIRARRASQSARAPDPAAGSGSLGLAQSVLGAVGTPVLALDAEGSVVLANDRALTLLGRSRANVLGRHIEELFSQPQLIRIASRAIAGERFRERVSIARPSGGAATFEVHAAPFREAGAGAVLTLLDVSELATAARLKTDFVANASHELRTPLASIRAAVETLGDLDSAAAPMRARLVSMISSNVDRLEQLLTDLLELSRLESGEGRLARERLDLSRLAADLHDRFAPACEARRIHLEFATLDGSIETSPRLLDVILANLVDNAIRFSDDGDRVDVRVLPMSAPRSDAPRGVRFEVEDRGQGIPLADQQRIFERFFQVDPARSGASGRGTGLGLSIVKHAVQGLGGTVGVQSVLGRGSTFWVELPECALTVTTATAPRTPHEAA